MVPSLLLSGISLCLGLEYMTTPPLGASSSEYRVGLSPHLSLTLCRALAVVLVSVSIRKSVFWLTSSLTMLSLGPHLRLYSPLMPLQFCVPISIEGRVRTSECPRPSLTPRGASPGGGGGGLGGGWVGGGGWLVLGIVV